MKGRTVTEGLENIICMLKLKYFRPCLKVKISKKKASVSWGSGSKTRCNMVSSYVHMYLCQKTKGKEKNLLLMKFKEIVSCLAIELSHPVMLLKVHC